MRCYHCMEEYSDTLDCCPHCHKTKESRTEPYQLLPGTLLNDRFYIGDMLGYGGFGITYIGWDALLCQKVAIKEYLPMHLAGRNAHQERIVIYDKDRRKLFEQGRQRFRMEAQRLALFRKESAIITVYHTFEENDTAYLVMEYVEGDTIESLVKRDGVMSAQQVREIMIPLLTVLNKVHEKGIIHRDIAPDNIYITKDGKVKLLDFGAAYSVSATAVGTSQSISMIIKRGYAPQEQYRSPSLVGPYSDVYSAAATMYYMLCGIAPQDSMERDDHEAMIEPCELREGVDRNLNNAIMNALILDHEQRTQSAWQLCEELKSRRAVRRKRVKERRSRFQASSRSRLAVSIATTVSFALCMALVFTLLDARMLPSGGHKVLAAEQTYMPGLLNEDLDSARQKAEAAGLQLLVTAKKEDDRLPSGIVLSQSERPGTIVVKGSVITVSVSRGRDYRLVENVTYMPLSQAKERLETAGFPVEVVYEDRRDHQKDTVISQSMAPYSSAQQGDTITLHVAREKRPSKPLNERMPAHMDVQEAVEWLAARDSYLIVTGYVESTEAEGTILSWKEGEQGVEVQVSSGPARTVVNDVELLVKEEAYAQLQRDGIRIETRQEYSDYIDAAYVLKQSIDPGTVIQSGDTIVLTISKGSYQPASPSLILEDTTEEENDPSSAQDQPEVVEEVEKEEIQYEWTPWTTDAFLSEDPTYEVETKTQYAIYGHIQTTAVSEEHLEGYTLIDKEDTHTYSQWSSWSDYIDGTAPADSDLVQYSETETQYRYFVWDCPLETRTPQCRCYPFAGYKCPGCLKDADVYSERLVWNAPPELHGKYYLTMLNGRGSWAIHWFGDTNDDLFYSEDSLIAGHHYRQRTREPLYRYTYESDHATPWQDAYMSSSESGRVVTRTLYRYRLKV